MEVAWENPSYDTDLGPPVLKWLKCQGCGERWADAQCQLCSKQFCRDCEARAHSEIPGATEHQVSLGRCNVCQDCQARGSEFYCKDCERYQCEHCCAASHGATDSMKRHVWMWTEGAATRLLRFGVWEPNYKEFTKMARRNEQLEMEKQGQALAVKEETEALPAYLPLPPLCEDEDATSDEEDHQEHVDDASMREAMEIKMEQVHLNNDVNRAAQPEVDALTAEPESVPVKPEPEAVRKPADTETDGAAEDTHVKNESTGSPVDKPAVTVEVDVADAEMSGITEDTQVKGEASAPSVGNPAVDMSVANETGEMMQAGQTNEMDVEFVEAPPAAPDVVDLTGDDDDEENSSPADSNARFVKKEEEPMWSTALSNAAGEDFFLDTDPIRCRLVREYNTETKYIHDIQQHSMRLTQRATSATNFHEIQDCKQQLDKLQDTTTKATNNRDVTLARLLVYLKHDDSEFQKLLASSGLNMPDAQTAIHRECARLQAEINAKGKVLLSCQAQVDEAIRVKPTESFTEVVRLGNVIKASEDAIRELEKNRLNLLGNLSFVSEAVRTGARAMMSESSSSSTTTT